MCLAIPVKVKNIKKNLAELEGGKKVKLSLVPDVQIGDYLLVHGNLVINKLSPVEAKKILDLIKSCPHHH